MRVGDTIAGYDIVARLKAGGMAALFLGKRHGAAGFAKHVAIKVIHEHLADDESFVEMFLDEARITARIEHPNVVHVHDLGEHEDNYFLVMEYIPSVPLTQLLRAVAKLGRRLSPEVATWIAIQIAAGLHAAHETTDDDGTPLGIVHRDISPKNILVAYKGYVKVIDFGIAKAAGRATKTQGGLLKGTFRYMSPEQARGRDLDARSDVYALGIVLWEMLVLRRLFDADNDMALLDMVRDPKITPPGQFVRCPPALDKVVLKSLATDPNDRYDSCDEMRMALVEAVPDSLRISARQIGQLIGATFADQVKVDVEPSVASAIGKPVTVQIPKDVLDRMTRSPNEELISIGAVALQPQPVLVTPTGSHSDPSSGVVPRDPPLTVTPTPSPDPFMTARGLRGPEAPPPAKKRSGLIAAMIAVPLLVAMGAAATWMMPSESAPIAEPLPPLVVVEPIVQSPVEVAEPVQPVVAMETPEVTEPEVTEPEVTEPEVTEPVATAPATMTTMRRRHRPTEMTAATMESADDTPRMRRRTTMTDDALLVDW